MSTLSSKLSSLISSVKFNPAKKQYPEQFDAYNLIQSNLIQLIPF